MIRIPLNEAELLPIGSSAPVVWKNRVWKFQTIPEETKSAKMNDMKERRKEFVGSLLEIEKEKRAVDIARLFLLPTPAMEIKKVTLVDGDVKHETIACVRDWVPGQVFETYEQLCLRYPIAFRGDYIYYKLVDLLLGCWDRNVGNLVYYLARDLFIPIDYSTAFSYDRVPMTVDGVEEIFRGEMIKSKFTNFFRINVLWVGNLFTKLCQCAHANKEALSSDRVLIHRLAGMQEAITQFFLKFKVGLDNIGVDVHGEFLHSIQEGRWYDTRGVIPRGRRIYT